jgi:hypothetical protein
VKCGICGEIRFDGRSAHVESVARMTAAMASRGPESDRIVPHGPEAFGHRRLSIIDLSARGAQLCTGGDASREVVSEHLSAVGADTAVDAALRRDTTATCRRRASATSRVRCSISSATR